MKLEQSFTVTAPVEQVWAALVDVERVAPCLPGAEITGQSPDGGYEGTFTVKLGPATAAYRGSLKMESLDEAARTATMSAKGTDKRGQGGATASIVSTMREEGDATHVEVVTDFTITGRLARFGRGGMIEDISKRLMRDFAQCLESTLGAEPAAAVAAASEPEQAEAEVASAAGAAAEPPAAAAEPAPPSGGEEPVSAAEEPAPAAPLGGEEPVVAEEAAASAALPGEDAEPARRAAEADPWGPLSPPAEPVAPAEEEAPAQRTHSIPPPSARPAAPPAKPVKGFSLLFGVLWDRIKAFFGRLFGRGKKD
jgi:carbon monoxide dehydrogenase subunit G